MNIMRILLTIFTVLILASSCITTEEIPIIDCHVHLWDTRRPEGISWPRPELKDLYRPYLPEHISTIAKKNGVKAIVAMQSGQTVGDNQWNLEIIEQDPLFKGVVGNLSKVIGTKEFKPLFLKLCENKKYLGYRLSGKYQDGLSDALIEDLKLTAKMGKSVDFLLGDYSFKEIAVLAEKVPNLRILMDHIGGIQLDGKPLDKEWVAEFKKMGRHKNVYCKVSALFGRFKDQPAPIDLKYYKEALDLAVDTFGVDRLVYSSDWPVTELTGDYTSVVKLTKSYFMPMGHDVAHKVFYLNALKFYRVPGLD